jgi:hypothetical protein
MAWGIVISIHCQALASLSQSAKIGIMSGFNLNPPITETSDSDIKVYIKLLVVKNTIYMLG